jgi:hypothetical protein
LRAFASGEDDAFVAAFNRCPTCGASLDPTQPDCPECHREVPEENLAAAEKDPVKRARKVKWPIPWGLLAMLAIYFGGVWFYTNWEYKNSPEYNASRHLRIAAQLLGDDDGKTVGKQVLTEAMDHLIAAVKLRPDNTFAWQRVELVRVRMVERKLKLNPEQQQIIDAQGMRYRADQDRKTSFMPIGARDIWDVEAVTSLPGQVAKRTLFGALIIVVIWIYKTLQDRKHTTSMALERQDERRRDLRDIAGPKRRIVSKKKRS